MFIDREDAATRLAAALAAWRGSRPLVLGIPRGAVPMARRIAAALGGEVDVVLVRKLRAPGNAEYAIGAVDESGWSFLGDSARRTPSKSYGPCATNWCAWKRRRTFAPSGSSTATFRKSRTKR
jgi:predicted phosphoribosyltransferase